MNDLDVELGAIAAGDPEAFGRWVAGAEHELRWSLASFAEAVDTEAVVQEALLRIWQVADRVEPDGRPNSLLRFSIRTARNLAIDHVRRSRRAGVTVDIDSAPEPELTGSAEALDPLLREAIEDCRDGLPRKPKSALAERLEGHGARHDRDLAGRLGMTLNTFLKNIGRARTLLTECLRKRGIDLGAYLGAR